MRSEYVGCPYTSQDIPQREKSRESVPASADLLAEHIVQLGGKPDVVPEGC